MMCFAVDPAAHKWPDGAESARCGAPGVDGQGRQARVTTIADEATNDPRVGTVAAGKYRILRLIGGGGMGRVYEAENLAIGKRVALKFVTLVTGAAGGGTVARARFHREARAVAAVESAHIVQIFDTAETEGGDPFLVMELLQGEDLAARLGRGRLEVGEALDLTAQALRGLRRAHAAGIIHRDLKPENLFLVPGDDDRVVVKLVDFGLSKHVGPPGPEEGSGPVSLTADGALLGTPLYMSPEQLEGAPDVDHRADLWSMGAILYEMLAGAPAFAETSYARLVIRICQREPEPLSGRAPGVPPAVEQLLRRALARDRAARFPSADELLAAVLEVGAVAGARRPAPSIPDSAPAPADGVSGSRPRLPSDPMAKSDPTPRSDGGAPGAELRTYTQSAATLWLSQSPTFSMWRGEVAAPDRLRIEGRDGSVHELRLSPVGVLRLGRTSRVGDEVNELVYADVASRLAATLRHDGVRWWVRRREECSVPVQIGARSLGRGEEAPLVHGTFVSVGGMRGSFVDRRFVTPGVPAGAVDPATGLLARGGIEQEIAAFLQRQRPGGLVVVRPLREGGAGSFSGESALASSWDLVSATMGPRATPDPGAGEPALSATQLDAPPAGARGEHPPLVAATMAVHRGWPNLAVACADGAVVLLVPGAADKVAEVADKAAAATRAAGVTAFACGYWLLAGESVDAGREVELALHAAARLATPDPEGAPSGPRPPSGRAALDPAEVRRGAVVALREVAQRARLATPTEIQSATRDARRATLLFAIEEQSALGGVGPQVVSALEKELCAVVATHAGAGALVAPLAPGVVVACVSRKLDAATMGGAVQCDWHARPPILDGKAELPRALSWEVSEAREGDGAAARAAELSRECADPHGVLSALSGGLPYPIAGRVHAAIASSSAVERVKMLFDVLEGTWRFIATVLISASFARRASPGEIPPGFEAILDLYRKLKGRDGYALGVWRELGRAAGRGFEDGTDPIGALARDVLGVRLGHNQTFETLSNLMQVERNAFAHGQYNEARAGGDLPEFEQMTRTLLRALRPLSAWTLVTVEKTEPDPYGDLQTVEFVDHTGPFNTGTRRRIGLNSPVRLANVVYLARWREGLVLPLDPMLKRVAHGDRFDLFWMDHLPRAGACQLSAAVGAEQIKVNLDARRLPPLMRTAMEKAAG
jgi:serine/threonine protein kinase